MKMTNVNEYPEALVRAVKNDPYNKGASDFSVTELIKPARIRKLEKLHEHEIEEDVSDRMWSLLGQAVHVILERSNKNDLVEKRFFANFEVNGKTYIVSAQLDSLDLVNGILTDWKVTTAWKFKNNSAPPADYVAQLNMQLELLRRYGLDASRLQIVGILRDWQMRQAKEDQFYPQKQVATMPIAMWSREQTVSYISMRIAAHTADELPECDESERWTKPHVWAVIKRGQKRAINGGIQLSQEIAEDVCAKNPGTFIQFRHGVNTRCESYCRVAPFCSFYQKLKSKEITHEI